jgi:HK97 family phage major capsid protein
MFVRFLQAIGRYAVADIDEFDDQVAAGFIATKQAEASTAGAWMAASRAAEMAAAETRMSAAIAKAVADISLTRGAPGTVRGGPPNGGGGVDFKTLGEQKDASERDLPNQDGKFGDILRCIHAVGARGTPMEMVSFAQKRLRNVYSDEAIEYKVDDATGSFTSVVTRNLPGGGTEVITRTGTDSLGGGATYGFTVKPEYLGTLFRIAREQEVFANVTRSVPVTQGVEVKYPALDQYQTPTLLNGIPQSAAFAGITLSYLGETAARVSSDGKTNEIDFKIVDMTGATDYSRDYIVDNFIAMDGVITGLFGEAMAFIEDWVCIRGSGLGQPQGYFRANATLQGGAASGNASRANAGDIASDDLAWMLSHLSPQCWRSARWITHPSTISQLFILNNKSQTPVFQPNSLVSQSDQLSIMKGSTSDGMINRPMGVLMGYPVYFTEKVPQLGTTGDISLVCPDQYGLATRAGIEIGVSEHFYFSTDRIAYRFKRRHDGRSLWRQAYTDISGATNSSIGTGWQSSPFIVLN